MRIPPKAGGSIRTRVLLVPGAGNMSGLFFSPINEGSFSIRQKRPRTNWTVTNLCLEGGFLIGLG